MKKVYIILLLLFSTAFIWQSNYCYGLQRPILLTSSGHLSEDMLLIRLKWTADEIYSIKGFRVMLKKESRSEFDLFADLDISDHLIVRNGDTLSVSLTKKNSGYSSGDYDIYIESYDYNNNTSNSNVIRFYISDSKQDVVYFTSEIPETGFVGEQLSFSVKAESNSTSPILYNAISIPDGMEFSNNTGGIYWIPTNNGYFSFTIEAYLEQNPEMKVRETWQINIFQCKNMGSFDVFIKDESEEPIIKGICELYEMIDDSLQLVAESLPNEDGVARFNDIDEREYYLLLNGNVNMEKVFFSEWYNNSSVPEYATPIYGKCGSVVPVWTQVERYPEFNEYHVSGKVTNDNGNSVSEAMIRFFGINPYDEDSFVAHASVDENGRFSLALSNEYKYYVYCYSLNDGNNSTAKPSFSSIFYDNAPNLMEADLLELHSDIDDLDFVLETREDQSNLLSGKCTDPNGNPITYANVSAFRISPDEYGEYNFETYSVCTDKNGRFCFFDLLPGDYIIYSTSHRYDKSIASYYNGNSEDVYTWNEAESIVIESNENYEIGNIVLSESAGSFGLSKIVGYISTNKNSIKKSNDPLDSYPLNGANIYLINHTTGWVGYTNTNPEGKFELSYVKEGKYSLIVDKVGYAEYSEKIGMVFDNEVISKNIFLSLEVATSFFERSDDMDYDLRVYPNPAKKHIQIEFLSYSNFAEIVITNTLGEIVSSRHYSTPVGLASINIGIENLPDSAYNISIKQADKTFNQIFIVYK